MRFLPLLLLGTVAGLSATACGPKSDPAGEYAAPTIRDSAGIRIVESHAPRERWILSAEPTVQIGVAEGDSMLLLDDVIAARRLSDGSIVVVNCAPPLLRWFSSTGEFQRAAGRIGAGPGEFGRGECQRRMHVWRLPGDSIAAWEHSARRMKVFDRAGAHARDVSLVRDSSGIGAPYIVGRFSDGGFAVFFHPDRMNRPPAGEIRRDSMVFHHYRPDGAYGGPIGGLPGWSFVSWEFVTPGRTVRDMTFRPFGANAVSAVHGDDLYYGGADRFEIALYRRDGTIGRIVRRAEPPKPVTSDLIATFKANRTARSSEPNDAMTLNRMERLLGDREFPETLPAYNDVRVDDEGLLWVRNYPLPNAPIFTWSVFDTEGALLAELETPSSLQVLEFGRTHLLALARDSLDVEQVRLYTVARR